MTVAELDMIMLVMLQAVARHVTGLQLSILILPDMVLSSMFTVVGLLLCLCIQLCLLAPGPGLGLYPGLLTTPGDGVMELPYTGLWIPGHEDMDGLPDKDLTDIAGLWTDDWAHWGHEEDVNMHW